MIILLTEQEPLIFSNKEEVLDYVEAIDVQNGEYEAFDDKGRRLNMHVEYIPGKKKLFRLGLPTPLVSIYLREPVLDERDYLTTRLREFILRQSIGQMSPATPLATLIKMCDDFES